MGRRAITSLILGSLTGLLLVVGPVAGKMPFFSIELAPSEPRDGDVIVIVVRMWDDAAHTTPATWWHEATIEGLIEARNSTDRVPITLVRLDDATFRAEVRLSEGTWRLVTFPSGAAGSTGDGYPGPLNVTVGPAAPDTAGVAIAAGGALGAAALTLLVGPSVRRGVRRRRGSVAT